MLTRKHFNAIAEILKNAHPARTRDISKMTFDELSRRVTVEEIASKIAGFCRAENSRFDIDRFLYACQPTK